MNIIKFIKSFIPRKYYRVHYKKFPDTKMVFEDFCEIDLNETVYSVEILYMTPRRFESMREFQG